MTFLAGDWVKVVQVIDVKESEKRSDHEQRQNDKRKLIGTIRKIKRIKRLSAAVYTGQNITLEGFSHLLLFHADELEKVDFPQPPVEGDFIRFTKNGDICQVVAVRAEYRLFYRVVDDSVDLKTQSSDDLKTWSVSEFIGDRNVFQVLTQEEKLAHETATLVAKRNDLVAKASASMTHAAAAMQRAIADNEAINKEIVAINEQLEKLKPE